MKKNNVIKIFIICVFIPLTRITTMAQIDERFVGSWVLESAELRESEFNNPQKEIKKVYTSDNVIEVVAYFDAVTGIKLVKEQASAELENEEGAEELIEPVKALSSEFNFVTTLRTYYEKPELQISDRYFIFSNPFHSEELQLKPQYRYEFLTPDKLLLTSHEIFYANDQKASVKAQLYITLTRLSE